MTYTNDTDNGKFDYKAIQARVAEVTSHPGSVVYEEHSKTFKTGKRIVSVILVLLFIWMGYTIHRSIVNHALFLSDLFVEIVAILVVIKQATGHYTYQLRENAFVIKEKTLFRNKTLIIPYFMIDGIYAYHQEFFGQLRFRYKYRKVSSLDSRPIWAMAAGIAEGKKLKHARILIRGDEELFTTLERFIPGKVRVHQEEVVYTALLREEAYRFGSLPEEYLERLQETGEGSAALEGASTGAAPADIKGSDEAGESDHGSKI